MDGPAQASAELDQLADALTRQGYRATVIIPAPYLAIYLPGVPHPYMIYATDGRYWWHTRQDIASTGQTTRAAELIIWGLRACTTSSTTPRTSHGDDQQC